MGKGLDMTVTIFTQPYLLYLYSVNNYKSASTAQITLRAKDQLTLVFAARVFRPTSKISAQFMEHDVII